ncbi:hypothetical protein IMSHALPRED_000105 [Imshaugia aleurites]|uniref:Uncharacterized protein n=1 Tax=Imshaugia aleurites TaxID=172621 RepID=A0A8H3ECH8_9LECA|nr:hypothetical protein IMSHALPRED_000105 [Imshaugia aleurites]
MSNQFNQRGQGAGGYGQSPYGGGQHQQQQQQRPGIGSTQNTPDAASQSGQGEGYEDPDEQDLDPNTPSPQQSSKQPGQPQRPGQGQAQLNGSAGQVAKKPDGAAGGKTKASVAPQHAHSRFAQDPNHHATMQQFANIAKAGMNHDHIQSLVHVGTLMLAMLAHSSGMTAGHEEEDGEDKQ